MTSPQVWQRTGNLPSRRAHSGFGGALGTITPVSDLDAGEMMRSPKTFPDGCHLDHEATLGNADLQGAVVENAGATMLTEC